ncbi:MAG: tRNA-dihydrouridine synthase [Eubacterium sp.]
MDQIFEQSGIKISLRTRLGIENEEEFERLFAIYRKYPLEELIIHPRVQKDYYKNNPRMTGFVDALVKAPFPVVYNGDIFNQNCFERFHAEYPEVDRVMLAGVYCRILVSLVR